MKIYALVGGQFTNNREHKLYLVYPQENWVKVGYGTPYHISGASSYSKTISDRTLKYQDSMRFIVTQYD